MADLEDWENEIKMLLDVDRGCDTETLLNELALEKIKLLLFKIKNGHTKRTPVLKEIITILNDMGFKADDSHSVEEMILFLFECFARLQ